MSRQYQYIKLDNYYFCLQQNLLVLAWILFLKRDDLITIQPWLKKKNMPRWRMICSRYYWNILKQNLITLRVFAQCRLKLQKLDAVYLPVYGQFGMLVHKGYKVFNLRTRLVTKIFDPDVNELSIINEIEQLKKVSQINFAPSLRKWDINGRWYQEDYIRSNIASAHRSSDSGIFLKAFHKEALPCMHSLMLFQRPVTKDLAVYLKELIGIIENGKLLKKNLDSKEANIFREFVHSIIERLNAEVNHKVLLVFSHGDFCPANFLNTKEGLRIVDWESTKYRSLLFDFYSYFFYRPVSPKLPVDKMFSEINEALPILVSRLSSRTPDVTGNLLALVMIYRHLYYIERLCMLVERDLTDNRLNMTDYIMRYIEAYKGYENIINMAAITFNNKSSSGSKTSQS